MSITEQSLVQKALRRVHSHGAAAALHFAWLKLINLFVPFKILRGMVIRAPRTAFLSCPSPYEPGLLTAQALTRLAQDPATELTPHFLRDALAAGDQCYAIRHDERLITYGWYSTRPTPTVTPELLLHFGPEYVYMYKGFTADRYRGRRLHAIAKSYALRYFLNRGYHGVISYVESTNFRSLRSNARMGGESFGSIYLVRFFGRWFTFATPGCQRFGFHLEVAAPRVSSSARAASETR